MKRERTDAFYRAHLGHEVSLLDQYDDQWIVSGTLNYAKHPPSTKAMLAHFAALMDTLADENTKPQPVPDDQKVHYGDRLHWFARVEVGETDRRRHIHFLLGGSRVCDGFIRAFQVDELCRFLAAAWNEKGSSRIRPYEPAADLVAYLTKNPEGTIGNETRFSRTLHRLLLKRRNAPNAALQPVSVEGRDPLMVSILEAARSHGIPAIFGDQMPAGHSSTPSKNEGGILEIQK